MGSLERESLYDNIKAFLIFCVVFGHLIEDSRYDVIKMLYTVIYSFHMPMFVFISGMFAKFDPKKMVRRILLPYVVFQTIYSIGMLDQNKMLYYTTPFWALWYLLSLMVWHMLVPFLEGGSRKKKLAVLVGSILAALLTGFDPTVGYWMSFSRTVVFFPFFVSGYYYAHSEWLRHSFENLSSRFVLVFGGITAFLICFYADKIDTRWLYGCYNYTEIGYSPLFRLAFYLSGILLCAAILKGFPKHRTCFSYLGQYTMPIYLCHGFLVLLLKKCVFNLVLFTESQELVTAFLFSFLIVWLLGRNWKGYYPKPPKIGYYS